MLPAGSGGKHVTALGMTLRTVKALLKRQGTPSQLGGEMSHYVAEADSWSIERKGLAGDGGMLRAFVEEES
jgi:hypothetical protein